MELRASELYYSFVHGVSKDLDCQSELVKYNASLFRGEHPWKYRTQRIRTLCTCFSNIQYVRPLKEVHPSQRILNSEYRLVFQSLQCIRPHIYERDHQGHHRVSREPAH